MGVKVRRNASGVWCAQVYLGTAADGRRIRPYRSFPDADDEQQAQAMADAWAASLTRGGAEVRSTLIGDLLESYIAEREQRDIAPNTARLWRTFCRAYVRRHLGGRMAQDLTSFDLSRFEGVLLAPVSRGGHGLSRGTVRDVHMLLSLAYDRWVEMGVCEDNPMRSVTKPRADRREAVSLGEWDLAALDARLAELVRGEGGEPWGRRAAAFAAWLALHTGMRCGEACAVRRRDVSRRTSSVHVGGSAVEAAGGVRRMDTKGRRSRNVSVTQRELATIMGWCAAQDEGLGGSLGAGSPLVTADGGLMRPSYVSRCFSRVRDELGMPKGCTFHSLRHTHATWLLLSGVDAKTVSERLGHSDVGITLKVYAHVMPGRDQAAAAAFESFSDEARAGIGGVQTVCKSGGGGEGAADAGNASSGRVQGGFCVGGVQKTSKNPTGVEWRPSDV